MFLTHKYEAKCYLHFHFVNQLSNTITGGGLYLSLFICVAIIIITKINCILIEDYKLKKNFFPPLKISYIFWK